METNADVREFMRTRNIWVVVASVVSAMLWPSDLLACPTWTMTIHGTSMAPRLMDHERIFVEEPACGAALADVVVFLSDASKLPLIKSIRGLAGDRLDLEGSSLLVNGKADQ